MRRAFVVSSLAMLACGNGAAPPRQVPTPVLHDTPAANSADTIVATVDGHPVWASCVQAQAAAHHLAAAAALQECIDFDARLLHVQPRGTVYLEGYWQGEGYFKDVEDTIRADLQIRPPEDKPNLEMAARIRGRLTVAVHVRFFDAPAADGINNAPSDYYARAVAHMETLAPGAHYFLFSDQPNAARKRIPLTDDRVTLVSHNTGDENAYADLWLMTQCKHFIIANSTFSWWGAWLAPQPGKQVIAPGFEMRQGKMWWGFAGLLPKEWIKL